jgi:hypothetical protein
VTPRPQRPCHQPHGTVSRYVAGCSCFECCEAWGAYQRDRKAERRAGIERTVDAAPVREHIRKLMYSGWRTRAIAEQAALSYNTVRYVRKGWRTRITRESAEAILTLTCVPLATTSTALVPARPTLQRIERLRRRFSLQAIADAAGVTRRALPQPGQRSVQARTARRIRDAAERLREAVPS